MIGAEDVTRQGEPASHINKQLIRRQNPFMMEHGKNNMVCFGIAVTHIKPNVSAIACCSVAHPANLRGHHLFVYVRVEARKQAEAS